jgi:hypothetical protein
LLRAPECPSNAKALKHLLGVFGDRGHRDLHVLLAKVHKKVLDPREDVLWAETLD